MNGYPRSSWPQPLEKATTEADLEKRRKRAWLEQGIVVVNPADLTDDWLRQGLINFATKRWGKRNGKVQEA